MKINIINIFMWYLIIDTAAIAGTLGSPGLLFITIIASLYWYWKDPVFKMEENPNRED